MGNIDQVIISKWHLMSFPITIFSRFSCARSPTKIIVKLKKYSLDLWLREMPESKLKCKRNDET